ncbi:MAG: aldehyde dehydrogenase, partial [Fischerella sp.]|nr:aldehyde dehydrogenase [Fischerella sp.]
MTTPLTCCNYINGQWLSAASGTILESRNPANQREVVATFPRSASVDVDTAVAA